MNSDAAVKVKKEDLLNRYGFSSEIVKSLLTSFKNGQDSLVIGINGEWGCGKSSLMEFIKSEILVQTKSDPYRNLIYDFNPWRFQGTDELLIEFLKELGKKLGNYNEAYETLKADFNKIVDVGDKINSINPEITSKVVYKGLKGLIDLLKKPTSIEKLKSEADERLADQNIKLFVFIDDLDRCTPIEITQIFQVIKLNANFKNTIFFVAYDKEIIVSSLTKEYGKNGEKYLEKIVQVDCLVPKILPEKLKILFGENLERFNKRFSLNIEMADIESAWESGLHKYFTSLRHIYRLVNALELRIAKIFEDVSPFDFLILESIRIFDYSAYEWIYRHKEDLIYREVKLLSSKREIENQNKTKSDFIINHPTLKDSSLEAKTLITRLFDVDNSESQNDLFSNGTIIVLGDLDLKRRIASPKYFDHYFSIEVSSQNLPTKAIKDFIVATPEQKKTELTYYFDNLKFERFLDQLADLLVNDSFDKKRDAIVILLDQSDEQHYEIKSIGNFRVNALTTVFRTITKIGKSIGDSGEKRILLNLLLSKEQISYSRFYLLDQIHLRLSTGKIFPETEFFDENLIRDLQTEIKNKLKDLIFYFGNETINDPTKYDIVLIKYFLVRYHEFYPKEYNEGIIKLSSDPNSAVLLFRSSLTIATRSGYDKPGYNLSGTHFLPEFTAEKFEKIMAKTNFDELDDENKKFYNLFLKLKDNKFNKDQFFTIDLDYWEF